MDGEGWCPQAGGAERVYVRLLCVFVLSGGNRMECGGRRSDDGWMRRGWNKIAHSDDLLNGSREKGK